MNPFQAQYPLSPRKFWKKLLPTLFPTFLLSVILGLVLGLVVPVLTQDSAWSLEGMIAPTLLFIVFFFAIVTMLYAWYFKAYIRTYLYEGGDNFITIKKGVFAPKEIHVQYQKIQDVYVDQDLLDRIMGLYDVHIASATVASGMEAHIDGVEKAAAEGLKHFFLAKIQNPGAAVPMSPGMPAGTMPMQPSVVQLSEEISNNTYPIEGRWTTLSILGAFISSAIFGLFISGYFVAKFDESNMPFLPIYLGVSFIWFVFHAIGVLIWKSNYRFSFTPDYIQYHTGILSQSEQHLPYKSIQDVNTSQSILERMFGLMTVRIENAAQVAVGKRGAMTNASVKLVGLSPVRAQHLVEVLKPIILSSNSTRMGL